MLHSVNTSKRPLARVLLVAVALILLQSAWGSRSDRAEGAQMKRLRRSQQTNAMIKVQPVAQVTDTMAEMIRRDEALRAKGLAPHVSEPAPFLAVPHDLPVPPGAIIQGPSAAATADPALPEAAAGPLAPALTATFEALPDNGVWIPPDTNGAVGPNHLMVPLNSQVRVQTKTGVVLSTVSLSTFWASLGVSDVFDPKVIYDPTSGRFLFVACAERRTAASSMLFAVSATSDPTGAWYLWQLDGDASNTNWVDYPNIGVNTNWITFTSNMYSMGDAFAGVNIWIVNKSTALDGGAVLTNLIYRPGMGGTHVPCLTYSASDPVLYILNNWNGSSGLLRLYTITGTADAPTWTATSIFPTSSPWSWNCPDAPQLGSSNGIDTNDDRLMNAVQRNGSLWCAHAVALPASAPTRTAAKWWQINPITGAVIQSGVVEDTISGMFYYFPSIAVNANNEALLGFSGSSSTTYAGAYYTFRDSTTPAGAMQTVSLMKAGEAPYYKTFGGPRNRWGDYSATCVDPVDDTTLWTIQEYAKAPESTWGTWWGKLELVPGQRPIISLSANALENTVMIGGNAAPQSFEVWNSGETSLAYSISDDAYWLSCNPTSGECETEQDTITVQYATSMMTPGIYMATITVRDPTATNSPQEIEVTLRVVEAGLTGIDMVSPWNGTALASAPDFVWIATGGLSNAFAVDIGFAPTGPFYSTFENLHQPIYENHWMMPATIWNRIASGTRLYWRVRGMDMSAQSPAVITSDEVWSFTKR